jgi:hypothetical protein
MSGKSSPVSQKSLISTQTTNSSQNSSRCPSQNRNYDSDSSSIYKQETIKNDSRFRRNNCSAPIQRNVQTKRSMSSMSLPVFLNSNERIINGSQSTTRSTHSNDWTKYIERKKSESDREKSVLLKDVNLKKLYQEVCKERDSIPKCSPQYIKQLKRNDPIFAKRYKQCIIGRICNEAPKFDCNDLMPIQTPVKISKARLAREREKSYEMERALNEKLYQANIQLLMQCQIQKMDAKVKKFVQEFEVSC